MQSERRAVANSQQRSEGAAEAERIRADAERQRDIILAEAYRKAQAIKGEGDARAAAIYAEAYGKTPSSMRFTAAWMPTSKPSATRAMCWCSTPARSSSNT